MGVGEGTELEEGVVVEEIGVVDGGVVDFGNVDEVEDWLFVSMSSTRGKIADFTGESILEADLAGREGSVDDGCQVGVEGLGRVQQILIRCRQEEVAGAGIGVGTARRVLEPAIVLAACTSFDKVNWNQLVSIERCLDHRAIAQGLAFSRDGWV